MLMINVKALNKLFKPHEIECEDGFNYLSDTFGISDEEFLLETAMYLECSKSKDESCINTDCDYNLINEHSNELYLKIKENGGV